jgi:hypothetical protein
MDRKRLRSTFITVAVMAILAISTALIVATITTRWVTATASDMLLGNTRAFARLAATTTDENAARTSADLAIANIMYLIALRVRPESLEGAAALDLCILAKRRSEFLVKGSGTSASIVEPFLAHAETYLEPRARVHMDLGMAEQKTKDIRLCLHPL